MKGIGICWQQDDLTAIYADVVDADVWLLATPLYVSGPTGPLKTFLDRLLIPLGEPSLSLLDSHCHHPMRSDVKRGRVVLVSACVYWALDNFDLFFRRSKPCAGTPNERSRPACCAPTRLHSRRCSPERCGGRCDLGCEGSRQELRAPGLDFARDPGAHQPTTSAA